jgi:hypothetical protein
MVDDPDSINQVEGAPILILLRRIGRFHVARYTSMGSTLDPKRRSDNAGTFTKYFSDIQESITNTWRITLEVVVQYQGIENFRATCHNMWIQVRRDPEKEWLQYAILHQCRGGGNVNVGFAR